MSVCVTHVHEHVCMCLCVCMFLCGEKNMHTCRKAYVYMCVLLYVSEISACSFFKYSKLKKTTVGKTLQNTHPSIKYEQAFRRFN